MFAQFFDQITDAIAAERRVKAGGFLDLILRDADLRSAPQDEVVVSLSTVAVGTALSAPLPTLLATLAKNSSDQWTQTRMLLEQRTLF